MPSGKTHELSNMFFLPITLTVFQPEGLFPFIAGYLFSTFLLSPDLDLPQSNPSRRWGPLKIIWFPYQALFSHRSFFSHFPIISSLIRLVYLFPPIFIITFIIFKVIDEIFFDNFLSMMILNNVENINNLEEIIKNNIIYFTYGVIVSDIFHIFLDITVSYWNSLRKRLNNKLKFLKI